MGNGHDKHLASRAGRTTEVAARDIVDTSNAAGIGVGKYNLVQTHDVGNQWIDHDAACAGKDDGTAGCFLTDGQRLKLIIDFLDKTQTAQTNYKLAIEELRVEALLEKDSDLSWVISLMLDVVGAHFVSVIARSLMRLKAGEVNDLRSILAEASERDIEAPAMPGRIGQLLSNVKDKSIESYVKIAVDQSKKQLVKPLKTAKNANAADARGETVSYLDTLKAACDQDFQAYKDAFRGWRNDAEMVAIWSGMDPSFHQVSAYKDALSAKLGRFKASGVTDIGRKQTFDRFTGDADVYRDTRVLWLCDLQGNKTLWFQSQDGDIDPGVLHDDDPGSPAFGDEPRKFGPRSPRESPVLGKPVPDEFVESAILRSEAKWGPTPVIFDPALEVVRRWTTGEHPARGHANNAAKMQNKTGAR